MTLIKPYDLDSHDGVKTSAAVFSEEGLKKAERLKTAPAKSAALTEYLHLKARALYTAWPLASNYRPLTLV
jgi:hypothetical protein